jgi:hypothetical protein
VPKPNLLEGIHEEERADSPRKPLPSCRPADNFHAISVSNDVNQRKLLIKTNKNSMKSSSFYFPSAGWQLQTT